MYEIYKVDNSFYVVINSSIAAPDKTGVNIMKEVVKKNVPREFLGSYSLVDIRNIVGKSMEYIEFIPSIGGGCTIAFDEKDVVDVDVFIDKYFTTTGEYDFRPDIYRPVEKNLTRYTA